jgi:flagellar hook-length control protein FliK
MTTAIQPAGASPVRGPAPKSPGNAPAATSFAEVLRGAADAERAPAGPEARQKDSAPESGTAPVSSPAPAPQEREGAEAASHDDPAAPPVPVASFEADPGAIASFGPAPVPADFRPAAPSAEIAPQSAAPKSPAITAAAPVEPPAPETPVPTPPASAQPDPVGPATPAPVPPAATPQQPVASADVPPEAAPLPNAPQPVKPASPRAAEDDDDDRPGNDGARIRKGATGRLGIFGQEAAPSNAAKSSPPAVQFFAPDSDAAAQTEAGPAAPVSGAPQGAAHSAQGVAVAPVPPAPTGAAAEAAASGQPARAVPDLAGPVRLDRMLEQLRGELQTGKNEFRLALDPVELGRLDVNVAARGEGVVLRLTAERGDVAQWLRTDLPILQKAIEQDGLQVLGVEVRSWTDLENRGRDHQRDAEGFVSEQGAAAPRGTKPAIHRPGAVFRDAAAAPGLDLIV